MKFNKELLLKHKFWLLLALTLPLSLGALALLATSVSGNISRARDGLDKEQKRLKVTGTIRTPADIARARHEADIEKAAEKVVHEQAYVVQDALFTWPERVEKGFNFHAGLFAQQIKIKRGAGGGEMTKDADRLIHGVVIERGESFIEVQAKDKNKYKFYMSRNVVSKIPVEGDNSVKEAKFSEIRKGDLVEVAFHKGKYFNEPLTDRELQAYRETDVYLSQIDGLLEQVEPMTAKGAGVVQLKSNSGNWYYKKGEYPPSRDDGQKFLVFLDGGWVQAEGDISEEAWLAQEDLWIQRELYRLIRLANDYVSKFEGKGGEAKNTPYTFKNPFWDLKITWPGGAKLLMTITNRQDRKLKLDDLTFRVQFNKSMAPEAVPINGPPLGPHETRTLPTIDLNGENPSRKGVYGVEQALTWETAAVKRIDMITIGSLQGGEIAMCNRTYSDNQQSLKGDTLKQDFQVIKTKKPSKFDRGLGGRGRGPKGRPGRHRPEEDVVNAENEMTKHNLIRNRYIEVIPQVSRRVPVGLSLIVDQDHIDRVIRAFNNSKLRFLMTQLSLNRYPGSLRPQLPVETTNSGLLNPFDRPDRIVEQPQSTGSADEMETNIEMVLYGIVTLYDRYPQPLPGLPWINKGANP